MMSKFTFWVNYSFKTVWRDRKINVFPLANFRLLLMSLIGFHTYLIWIFHLFNAFNDAIYLKDSAKLVCFKNGCVTTSHILNIASRSCKWMVGILERFFSHLIFIEYKIFSVVRHLLPVKQESYMKYFQPRHFICRVRIIWFPKECMCC